MSVKVRGGVRWCMGLQLGGVCVGVCVEDVVGVV